MYHLITDHSALGWALTLVLAWLGGQFGWRWLRLPPNIFYISLGFILSAKQLALLPPINNKLSLSVVNLALGLSLFEFGYRINLHWLKNNSSLIWTSIVESGALLISSYIVLRAWGFNSLLSLEFASLTIATSPVVILYLVNLGASAGQVTERIIHLTCLNWIMAVFCFKFLFGIFVYQTTGSFLHAAWSGMVLVVFSAAVGIAAGYFVTKIFPKINFFSDDRTTGILLVIILLTEFAKFAQLSSLLVTLAFGLSLRYQRVVLGQTQHSLGGVGEVALIAYFLATPSIVNWHSLASGLGLALILSGVRLLVKLAVVGGGRHAKVPYSKKLWSGMALMPISIFPLLLLDQSDYSGLMLIPQLAPFSATILLLDIVGPYLTYFALRQAKECHETK